MLVCFRAEQVLVKGKKAGSLVGIAKGKLSPSGEYRAII